MSRPVKNGHYININIDMDAFKILEQHCRVSGQTKTVAIERAIRACYGPNKIITEADIAEAQNDIKAEGVWFSMRRSEKSKQNSFDVFLKSLLSDFEYSYVTIKRMDTHEIICEGFLRSLQKSFDMRRLFG